jgi:hypothetical protein
MGNELTRNRRRTREGADRIDAAVDVERAMRESIRQAFLVQMLQQQRDFSASLVAVSQVHRSDAPSPRARPAGRMSEGARTVSGGVSATEGVGSGGKKGT